MTSKKSSSSSSSSSSSKAVSPVEQKVASPVEQKEISPKKSPNMTPKKSQDKSRSSSASSKARSKSNSSKKITHEIESKPVNVESPKKRRSSISEAIQDNDHPKGAVKDLDMGENFEYNKQKLDPLMVFLAGGLILCSFMMGQQINALGNEDPIRGFFAQQLGLANNKTSPQLLGDNIWSIGCMFPFGGLVGALAAAYTIEEFGRKYVTIIFSSCMLLGQFFKIISAYSHITLLFFGRFFDGLASAGLMVTSIMWMFECLPRRVHFIFKPSIQILINLGIFFTAVFQINVIMGEFFQKTYFFSVITTLIHIFFCFGLPESSKWVYSKSSSSEKAEKLMKKLRGKGYSPVEFQDMKNEVDEEKKLVKMSLADFITSKRYLRVSFIAMFIHLSQQISGINAIVAFTVSILNAANVGQPDQLTLIILGVGTIGSIIFAPVVSNFHRKIMLVTGHSIMSISFAILMICVFYNVLNEVQLLFYALFMFIFQIGPGPLVWFISMEIFPPSAIGAAQGVTTTVNWFGNMMIYLLFPIINGQIGTPVLFIFVVINLIIASLFALLLVETKDKTPEQVLAEYEVRLKKLHLH